MCPHCHPIYRDIKAGTDPRTLPQAWIDANKDVEETIGKKNPEHGPYNSCGIDATKGEYRYWNKGVGQIIMVPKSEW